MKWLHHSFLWNCIPPILAERLENAQVDLGPKYSGQAQMQHSQQWPVGCLHLLFCTLSGVDSLEKKQICYTTNNIFRHLKPLLLLTHFMLPVLSKLILCACACMPKFRDITWYLIDIKGFHFYDFEKQIKGKRIDFFPIRHMPYNLLLLISEWNSRVLNIWNGPRWCCGI